MFNSTMLRPGSRLAPRAGCTRATFYTDAGGVTRRACACSSSGCNCTSGTGHHSDAAPWKEENARLLRDIRAALERHQPSRPLYPPQSYVTPKVLSYNACQQLQEMLSAFPNQEIIACGWVNDHAQVSGLDFYFAGKKDSVRFSLNEIIMSPLNYDVMIHSHVIDEENRAGWAETLELQPSQEDLKVASELARYGIGSCIVDSDGASIRILETGNKLAYFLSPT